VRLSGLFYFYGRRLRTRPVQELLAGLGIAIGVALVFAVQVANSSITDASSEIVRGIAGTASLQLRSRDTNGFDGRLIDRVRRLPGVLRSAPVLDQNATIVGPNGQRVAIYLAGASPSLLALGGSITQNIALHDFSRAGVILPSTTAKALGLPATIPQAVAGAASHVSLQVRGIATPVRIMAVLGPEAIGPLSGAMAALAPLALVQRIAGLPGRVTRILVTTKPGLEENVRRELTTLAAGHLEVASADQDVELLKHAVAPNAEATGFFALVSAIVGFLLAFNAMLLTVPERRRVVADLRIQGMRPVQLVKMLLFQALCLGVLASLAGLLAGDLLARGLFHETPSYLTAAFPLGTQTIIGLRPVAISFAGGVLATCLAASSPLLDLRRGRAVDAVYFEGGEPGQALGSRAQLRLFAAGGMLILATSGLLIFWPSAVVVATVGLALAALLMIPLLFRSLLWLAEVVAIRTARLNMLSVALRALRATTVRSLALAATGAVAVFGSVIAEGSHQDLLNGLYRDYSQYVSTADLWIVNNNDDLATQSFSANGLPVRVAAVRGVASVRSYQGGFLDYDGRRIWVIARAAATPAMIPPSQIEEGNLAVATARLRAGGWITVSQQIARAHHVMPGGTLTLPTPTGPVAYLVAATTTNLGWSSGAIVLNSADYSRAWATSDPSALEVSVRPGAGTQAVKEAVQRVLGPSVALKVQTSGERSAQADALARQGLGRLSQISQLLMIAAALAMAAAMGAAIWQRRPTLASLRIQSFSPRQLRSILLYESVLVLGTGCLTGALAGIYGHLLSDRFLRLTTGFPAPFSPEGLQAVQTTLLIVIAALLALAIPGYVASQAPPRLALQE
jgi:putative ABC transport system permease protein